MSNPYAFGTLLFDLAADPGQRHPLVDDELELRMAELLTGQLRATDAPEEQYQRLGLPRSGPVTGEHLLARRQQPQAIAARRPAPRPEDYPTGPVSVHVPLRELLTDPATETVLRRHLAGLLDGPFVTMAAGLSLLQIAAFAVGLLPHQRLDALAADLATVATGQGT